MANVVYVRSFRSSVTRSQIDHGLLLIYLNPTDSFRRGSQLHDLRLPFRHGMRTARSDEQHPHPLPTRELEPLLETLAVPDSGPPHDRDDARRPEAGVAATVLAILVALLVYMFSRPARPAAVAGPGARLAQHCGAPPRGRTR